MTTARVVRKPIVWMVVADPLMESKEAKNLVHKLNVVGGGENVNDFDRRS